MTPTTLAHDVTHRGLGYAEEACDLCLRHTSPRKLTNFSDGFLRELRVPMCFTALNTPLLGSVFHVYSLVAAEQVRAADTTGFVTSVKNTNTVRR